MKGRSAMLLIKLLRFPDFCGKCFTDATTGNSGSIAVDFMRSVGGWAMKISIYVSSLGTGQ